MKKLKTNPKQVLLAPLKPSIWHTQVPMVISAGTLTLLLAVSGLSYMLYATNELVYDGAEVTSSLRNDVTSPFPIGIDPKIKRITENPAAESYLDHPASRSLALGESAWWVPRVLARLSRIEWYQNLASPSGRILIIEPGERREEVRDNFGKLLGWSTLERDEFTSLVASGTPELIEGKFFPGTYVVSRDAMPASVAHAVHDRFKTEILNRYPKEVSDIVPLEDTLTIASLLEREAYDFEDMRLISGVIWNRLFADMKLQLDATMQYARGESDEWWPVPHPDDKNIQSPYNTYQVEGLPKGPIANPSLSAILAALNPRDTECMFYFHDARGGFHCSKTYEEHVAGIERHYGR